MISRQHEDVFTTWVTEHQGLLFKVVRSHEANPEDQHDLLQEILLQLWRSVPAFSGSCKETTWIYRVALNTSYAWCRTEKKRRTRKDAVFESLSASATAIDPAEVVSARSNLESLYRAIRRLPRSEAALIILHLDGLSPNEISAILGITQNHVGVRLSRARKQLGELLKGELQ